MNLYEKIAKSGDDPAAQIDCVRAYIRDIYGISSAPLASPDIQGQQFYTLIGEDSVFRVARHPSMKSLLANESMVMCAIHGKTSLATPAVLNCQPEQFIIQIGKLPGAALSRDQLLLLDPRQLDEIAVQCGQFMAEIHDLMPQHGETETPPPRDYIMEKIGPMLKSEHNPAKRVRLEAAADFCCAPPTTSGLVMIHGDMHPGNLMFQKESGFLGVIDFTSAKIAPPYRDFVKIKRSFSEEHYDMAVRSYEKTSGIEIDRAKVDVALDAFEIFVSGKLFSRKESAEQPSLAAHRPDRHPGKALAPKPCS